MMLHKRRPFLLHLYFRLLQVVGEALELLLLLLPPSSGVKGVVVYAVVHRLLRRCLVVFLVVFLVFFRRLLFSAAGFSRVVRIEDS